MNVYLHSNKLITLHGKCRLQVPQLRAASQQAAAAAKPRPQAPGLLVSLADVLAFLFFAEIQVYVFRKIKQ